MATTRFTYGDDEVHLQKEEVKRRSQEIRLTRNAYGVRSEVREN